MSGGDKQNIRGFFGGGTKYQHVYIGSLLFSVVFFSTEAFSAWETEHGKISSEKYGVKQKKGGSQEFRLNFSGSNLILEPVGYSSIIWEYATTSLLNTLSAS